MRDAMRGAVTAVLPSRWSPQRVGENRLILICGETNTYRALARSLTLESDSVLELGCSYGHATVELALRARHVTAVDNSIECVQVATEKLSAAGSSANVAFHQLDVFGNEEQLLAAGAGCTAVFCDLGGARALNAAYVSLLVRLQESMQPAVHVIKCRELHRAATRAVGSGDGGPLPLGSTRFWADMLAAVGGAPGEGSAVASSSDEVDATRVPSEETRLCYSFLNRGTCARSGKGCTFRHLMPSHPDAIADARKRAAVGWKPERVRGRLKVETQ